jgi:hypothetical protein
MIERVLNLFVKLEIALLVQLVRQEFYLPQPRMDQSGLGR